MTNYLAIDVGEKHHGVAFANGPLATPIKTIHTSDLHQLTHQLLKLAQQYSVTTIILGLPSGKLRSIVLKLKELLQQSSSLKIILHSESLSTYDALVKLREIKASRHKLKNDHVYSASLILEDYLDSLNT